MPSPQYREDRLSRLLSRVYNTVVLVRHPDAGSLFVNSMPPRTTEKSYRPRVSNRTMVDTRTHAGCFRFACCASEIEHLVSLFRHPLRTVLAVKGSLRRAWRRALDGSGPVLKNHPV